MPCSASGTRFLDLNHNVHFEGQRKEEGSGAVSRLLLGHFAGRDELSDLSEYEKIILKGEREREHEGVAQIHVAQNGIQVWVTVSTAMNIRMS
jgi:hypothetical protein